MKSLMIKILNWKKKPKKPKTKKDKKDEKEENKVDLDVANSLKVLFKVSSAFVKFREYEDPEDASQDITNDYKLTENPEDNLGTVGLDMNMEVHDEYYHNVVEEVFVTSINQLRNDMGFGLLEGGFAYCIEMDDRQELHEDDRLHINLGFYWNGDKHPDKEGDDKKGDQKSEDSNDVPIVKPNEPTYYKTHTIFNFSQNNFTENIKHKKKMDEYGKTHDGEGKDSDDSLYDYVKKNSYELPLTKLGSDTEVGKITLDVYIFKEMGYSFYFKYFKIEDQSGKINYNELPVFKEVVKSVPCHSNAFKSIHKDLMENLKGVSLNESEKRKIYEVFF